MSEYVMKWRYLRYPDLLDVWYRMWRTEQLSARVVTRLVHENIPGCLLQTVPKLHKSGWRYPSSHGGKTECYIYQPAQNDEPELHDGLRPMELAASAETICSWRDQFDRRAGRLYSLALALCKLDAEIKVRWTILLDSTPDTLFTRTSALVDAIEVRDESAVRHICTEIVARWHKLRLGQSQQVKTLYREAMQMCNRPVPDDDSDGWRPLDLAMAPFNATDAQWELLLNAIGIGDKSEVADICAEIINEFNIVHSHR